MNRSSRMAPQKGAEFSRKFQVKCPKAVNLNFTGEPRCEDPEQKWGQIHIWMVLCIGNIHRKSLKSSRIIRPKQAP